MATQVIMPKLSPTMEEGQISRWLKKEGDKVSMGEPLAEIDTDKATMEMQALSNGVLRKILINEGESAPLGQMIAIIGEPDEDISQMVASAGSSKSEETSAPTVKSEAPAKSEDKTEATNSELVTAKRADENGREATATMPSQTGGRLIVSPLAARMAAEAGIRLQDSLIRPSCVFHFCNSRSVRAAHPACSVHRTIVHLVVGVEDHRDNFFL